MKHSYKKKTCFIITHIGQEGFDLLKECKNINI